MTQELFVSLRLRVNPIILFVSRGDAKTRSDTFEKDL